MARKVIMAYCLKGVKKPLKVTRKIYGYVDHSNRGKYKYVREGILSGVEYEKLSRGCVMMDLKEAKKVREKLEDLGIQMSILEVEVKKRNNFG